MVAAWNCDSFTSHFALRRATSVRRLAVAAFTAMAWLICSAPVLLMRDWRLHRAYCSVASEANKGFRSKLSCAVVRTAVLGAADRSTFYSVSNRRFRLRRVSALWKAHHTNPKTGGLQGLYDHGTSQAWLQARFRVD